MLCDQVLLFKSPPNPYPNGKQLFLLLHASLELLPLEQIHNRTKGCRLRYANMLRHGARDGNHKHIEPWRNSGTNPYGAVFKYFRPALCAGFLSTTVVAPDSSVCCPISLPTPSSTTQYFSSMARRGKLYCCVVHPNYAVAGYILSYYTAIHRGRLIGRKVD